jgi:predicted transposase YbfD/YdcC
MVRRERHFENKTETEKSYYIGSIKSNAENLAHAIRSHWEIENSLHWVRDFSSRGDESRIRKDNAPGNFSVLKAYGIQHDKKGNITEDEY